MLDRLRAFVRRVGRRTDDVDAPRGARASRWALGGDGDGDEPLPRGRGAQRRALRCSRVSRRDGPVVLVFEDLQEADPAAAGPDRAAREGGPPGAADGASAWPAGSSSRQRPSWAGGHRRRGDAVGRAARRTGHAIELAMEAGGLRATTPSASPSTPAATRSSSSRSPACCAARSATCRRWGPAPSGRLLPPTVQAVIAARIDQLDPDARELVRRASVFPRGRFDLEELSLIVEPRQELLDEAEDDELLVRDEDRPGVWRFGSRRAPRRRLRLARQARAAASAPARGEQALRRPRPPTATRARSRSTWSRRRAPRSTSTRGDRTLAERAVEALANAGDLARRRIESRVGGRPVRACARALPAPRRAGASGRPGSSSMLGEARYWLGEFDAAESALHRALAAPAGTQRPGDRARVAVPRRHHAHDPR